MPWVPTMSQVPQVGMVTPSPSYHQVPMLALWVPFTPAPRGDDNQNPDRPFAGSVALIRLN